MKIEKITTTQLIRALSIVALLTGIWCIFYGFVLMDPFSGSTTNIGNIIQGGFILLSGGVLFGFSLLNLTRILKEKFENKNSKYDNNTTNKSA